MLGQSSPVSDNSKDCFAFAHRAVVNADGLFRRLGCDADHQKILDVWWRSTAGIYVRFWGPNLLGENEALVLIALLARAGELHRCQLREVHAEQRAAQVDPLDWLNSALGTTVAVTLSLRTLAESVGLGCGGASLDSLKRSLERLGAVSVWIGREFFARRTTIQNHQLIKMNLLEDGSLSVVLAPLLIDAMLGSRRDNTYVLLSSIVRLPARGYSRLLAIRLAWINPGEVRELKLETLAGYLWFGRLPTRVERTKIRAALVDLGSSTEWTVSRKPGAKDEVYAIRRVLDSRLRGIRQVVARTVSPTLVS